MLIPQDESRLLFFTDLYAKTKSQLGTIFAEFGKHYKQYIGDDEIDGSPEKAKAVRNITYELIESKIDTNIPSPKVSPLVMSDGATRRAESIERLLGGLRDRQPYERMNDTDERNTYIYGASVWLVEWDESVSTHYTAGDVKLTIISPTDFFPQPNLMRVEDMDYLFIRYTTTREEVKRRYPIKSADGTVLEADAMADDTTSEETITVVVCYYKDDQDNICRIAWSGDLVLEDISDYYSRKTVVCDVCGRKKAICTCDKPKFVTISEDYEELTHDIQLSDGKIIPAMSPVINDDGTAKMHKVKVPVMDEQGAILLDGNGEPTLTEVDEPIMQPTKIPYYKPKTLPVIVRTNVPKPSSIFGQSDCATIRPYQQAINKVESRIMLKLMNASVTPVMPEDATIAAKSGVFDQVIQLKLGERANQYGVIDTTPDVSRDMVAADRIYDQAKRTLGVTDSYQGNRDNTAQSGKAKQVQVAQSAGRLESGRVIKYATHADIDCVIYENYLAYADEPRPISYRDRFGKVQNKQFNRYDFVQYDKETGDWFVDDGYRFSVNVGGLTDENREAMWESVMNMWRAGMFGNPADLATLVIVWNKLEKYHYPDAHDEVARYTEMYDAQQAQIKAQQAQLQTPQIIQGVQ